ncbi:MAG: phenylalanine ammonia-lyase, partial [Deltaproteobacteria bacterium]
MSITLGTKKLTIEDVVRVARDGEQVELAAEALDRIVRCRAMLERKIEAREVMYGVNTGIGEFSEVALSDEQVKDFQRYLIYNHAAGIGEPCPIEHVRAAMLSRVMVHTHGHSGGRPEITQTYLRMLNAGVTPVTCEKGSVGACGDLAPLSQIALSLLGEGEAFYEGERMPTRAAMERAGIPIPGLQARDGLSAINGSNLITGMSCLILHDAERWLKQAEIGCAMTLEALLANMKPYQPQLHALRGFPGAQKSAANLRAVTEGSDLRTGKLKVKVQDAYSMRSSPQVIGAARDLLDYARKQVEIELNGVADNPIFLPDEDLVLTGANF